MTNHDNAIHTPPRLRYIHVDRAWYADPNRVTRPTLTVGLADPDAAADTLSAVTLEEYAAGTRDRDPALRLTVFGDAFEAFTQAPAFFAALAEQQPRTITDAVAILTGLGATDVTAYTEPQN